MKKTNFLNTAKNVIDLEIKALQDLKKNINRSFNEAVVKIANCQSKVILELKKWINCIKDCSNTGICWNTFV